MVSSKSVVKAVLPARAHQLLGDFVRRLVFSRAMRKFLKNPDACTVPDSTVLSDLVAGWGNHWSAMPEYLVGCIKHALMTDGPILECGSGLSTVIIGAIAQKRGYAVYSLEHTPEWGAKVQKYLDRYQISSVVLCVKPLKNYSEFMWYDPPLDAMPEHFELVICDGPPGATLGGRYGLVPVMKSKLKQGSVILLDDAEREEERAIAKRWETELGGSRSEISGSKKPYIQMTVA